MPFTNLNQCKPVEKLLAKNLILNKDSHKVVRDGGTILSDRTAHRVWAVKS